MATFTGNNAANTYTGPWGEANVILGLGGNDTLTGGGLADSIDGGADDDVLNGRIGSDILIGGDGNDSIIGGEGNDEITDGKGNDTVDAGSGDDLIDLSDALGPDLNLIKAGSGDDLIIGGKGKDTLDGGIGNDIVSYATANALVELSLYLGKGTVGWANNDTYVQIENVIGSDFSDKIDGDSLSNILDGGAGGDKIKGKGGDDILVGGYGQDTIFGGRGGDQMDGGAGIDTLSYVDSLAINIDLQAETFLGNDAAGDSAINFEIIRGSDSGSIIYGDASDNQFIGGNQSDTLDGRAGNDVLDGGDSPDNLFGGAGDDTLSAGAQTAGFQDGFFWTESLEGGAGVDVVLDYVDNEDKLYFNYTTPPDVGNWTETAIDWGGAVDPDATVDDLQIVTDVGITIILLNTTAAQFDINDTYGTVA